MNQLFVAMLLMALDCLCRKTSAMRNVVGVYRVVVRSSLDKRNVLLTFSWYSNLAR